MPLKMTKRLWFRVGLWSLFWFVVIFSLVAMAFVVNEVGPQVRR